MLVTAVAFWQIILAVHIVAVVVTFGVTFAYPVMYAVSERLDQRSMPWLHRLVHRLTQRVVSPGLGIVLLAGIYLASKLHMWHAFYVQWGLAIAVVLGGLAGGFFVPREQKLAELAQRDIAAAGEGAVQWSEEYLALRTRVSAVGGLAGVLVLATIYFMTVQTGA
jgi:hypothetical protein